MSDVTCVHTHVCSAVDGLLLALGGLLYLLLLCAARGREVVDDEPVQVVCHRRFALLVHRPQLVAALLCRLVATERELLESEIDDLTVFSRQRRYTGDGVRLSCMSLFMKMPSAPTWPQLSMV